MEIESWLAFCSIALLATATPGPAVLLVCTHSLMFGFRKSLFTILGNISGLMVMSSFSVLGLSTVVLNSGAAFSVIKFLGAIYLIYMGISLWMRGISLAPNNKGDDFKSSAVKLYSQGLLVAITNPKAIVFTTALFPQFISTSKPLAMQFSILVFSFMSLSFIFLSLYSCFAQRVKSKTVTFGSGSILGKLFGACFVSAGGLLASASR